MRLCSECKQYWRLGWAEKQPTDRNRRAWVIWPDETDLMLRRVGKELGWRI